MPLLLKKRREGRKKWVKELDNSGNIEGFIRIRHYGLLANRRKASALRQCRQRLGQLIDPPVAPPKTVAQWVQQWTGLDITRCPQCGYQPLVRTPVPRSGDASRPRAP